MRTVREYRNLELVVEWRHLKPAGNSGGLKVSPFHNQFQIPVFSDRPHDTDGASCAVNFTLWKAPC
ncbi:MAG: hypothetical protein ACKPJD_25650, partial [Planctomycetaceae bacterium]